MKSLTDIPLFEIFNLILLLFLIFFILEIIEKFSPVPYKLNTLLIIRGISFLLQKFFNNVSALSLNEA